MKPEKQYSVLSELVNNNHYLRHGRILLSELEPENFCHLKDISGNAAICVHFFHFLSLYRKFINSLPRGYMEFCDKDDASFPDYPDKNSHPVFQYTCPVRLKDDTEKEIAKVIYDLLTLREHPPESMDLSIHHYTHSADIQSHLQISTTISRELYMLSHVIRHQFILIDQIIRYYNLEVSCFHDSIRS